VRGLLAITALLMSSAAVPLPAIAEDEPPTEIFCSAFHPGATWEELLQLCAEDVPPPNYGWPGSSGTGYFYYSNGRYCFFGGRLTCGDYVIP